MKFSPQFRNKDLDKFFSLSGIREDSNRAHCPFIVFKKRETEICFSAKDLIQYYKPDLTVICQWAGTYRSDFFVFKIQQLIDYIKKNPKEDYHIL